MPENESQYADADANDRRGSPFGAIAKELLRPYVQPMLWAVAGLIGMAIFYGAVLIRDFRQDRHAERMAAIAAVRAIEMERAGTSCGCECGCGCGRKREARL